MDFSELKQRLEQQKDLRSAAQSEAGQKLMQRLDTEAVERAAKSGDTAALQRILSQVLSTPEGRELAQQVQKATHHE